MTTLQKRTGRIAGLALAALLVLPGLASAATYYVSTAGNDGTGDGSFGNPWKTITHAAANVPAGTAATPNIISVAAGTYDTTTNGEAFPIVFSNNHVSLTGAGAATTTIDPETNSSDALHLDATGISVSGFTFINASDADAIVITEGGFTIANNVFETTVNDGVSFYRPSETDRTTSVSFADMAITNNTFKTRQNGIYVSLEIDFDDTVTGLTASFGNFTIANNTFPLTSGDGIYISNLFSPEDISNGTVTVGNLTVTGNAVTGGSGGIYFYSYAYSMENSQVTVGNIVVNNNPCTNQSSYGIYVDYWDMGEFYGTTNAVFGNLTVSGNTVTVTDYATYSATDGIYISDIDYIEYIYDQTAVTTGSINITNNTVDVDDYGIYLYSYGIYYIGESGELDSVSVTTGTHTVSGNTVNSHGSYGFYADLYYIGYDMYGTSTVNYGDFAINNNTITSYSTALYLYWYESGIYMYENSSASIGSMTISGNTLTASNDDAFEFYNYYGGYDMNLNSAVTYGPTSITGNTLTAGSGYGMYFEFYETPYDMYDDASFAMGNFTIDDNTINAAGGDGINVYYYDYEVGSYMEDNSIATLPGWIITDNTIDVTGGYSGLYFYNYGNPYSLHNNAQVKYGSMLIDGNIFNQNKDGGMEYGIYLYQGEAGYDMNDASSGSYGPVTITDNTFYAIDAEAIYLEYYYFGYTFYGAPTLTMGDIEIGNNTIDTAPYGIDVYFYDNYTQDKARVNVGKLNIHDNTLSKISKTGIYVDYYNYNDDPDTALLTVGAPTISGNTVTGAAGGDGIYLYVNNPTEGITFGMPTVSGNTVTGFDQGIFLQELEEASLSCNYLENNASVGMRFATAGTNFAVNQNSLVGNNVGLLVDDGYAAVINAEYNWWGDKLGPVACPSCNGVDPGDAGTVDFTPWLTYQIPKSSCGKGFSWILFIPAITGMGSR